MLSPSDLSDTNPLQPLDQDSPRSNFTAHPRKVGAICPRKGFYVNVEALEDNNFIDEDAIKMGKDESTKQALNAF